MGHLSFTGSKTAFLVSLLIFLTTFSASLVKPEEPAYPFGNVEVKMNMQTDEPILYGPPTINDIIPMEKDLTQFVDCLRTFGDIIDLISDPNSTITLFAPVNSAFRNLTRKPNYVGNSLEDPNKKMYQFVLGHIVPAMYQSLPVGQELQTMRKETTVKVEKNKNGYKLNGEINTGITKSAVNGIIYKIDGVLVKNDY